MKRHPLTLAGAGLTTISAVLFIFVFLMDMFGLHTNPYLGIVFFIFLPTFFVMGLLMIPAGIILERRRVAKGLAPHRLPHIDLNIPRHRRVAIAVMSLTLVNVLIVSLAAFKGLEVMDSPEFCGQVCHTVMEPEFVAYKEGPHSRVKCVDCHIGPGASWFVKSKLDGTRQVIAVMRNSYSKPISTPVRRAPAGARHVRALPLARQVPWRQGRGLPRVRRRRAEQRECDADAGSHRRRQRAAGRRVGHPLAHERGQRDRVRGHRRQAPGDSLRPPERRAGERSRVPRARRDRRADRQRGTADTWTAWTATTGRATRSRPRPNARSTVRLRAARFRRRYRSRAAQAVETLKVAYTDRTDSRKGDRRRPARVVRPALRAAGGRRAVARSINSWRPRSACTRATYSQR